MGLLPAQATRWKGGSTNKAVHRSTRVAAAAVALSLFSAACQGSPGPRSSSESGPKPRRIQSGITTGHVTLTVWDQDVRAAQEAEITKLNRMFERRYPNVTIHRVARSFFDLKSRLQNAVSGGRLPDVVQVNQGWADMGQLVRAGLLRPLDGYAHLYHWRGRYPRSLLDFNSFSGDGRRFGEGSLFGLSQEGELVGVYYNKSRLRSLKLKVPRTLSQFESELEVAQRAGQVPIQFGNLDKFPGIHEWQALQNEFTPPGNLRDLVLGRSDIAFDTEQNLLAASKLREWVDRGYFARHFEGIGYDDAWKRFTRGQGLFLITGTWLAEDLDRRMPGNVGFFPMPPQDVAKTPVATGGEGLAFAITDQSRHPNVAAAYIDLLTDALAERVIIAAGGLPAMSFPSRHIPTGSPLHEIFAAWRTISKHNGVVPYLDYATPTFYGTITAGVQNLMSGLESPKRFLDTLQENYTTFQGLR
ncbi:MAG: raffinose/stachyose/melibiose transport system substrate-binding protein [Actinomycetota bacterium]|nr:raffinose/stachyose/melibiose transport system substrate-binding protein [Actinomycetota bacterium]